MNKTFLLADDDSDDAALFREALEDIDPTVNCRCVEDGNMVLEDLNNPALEKPQVIFLDINMPGMNGWECLVELKNNDAYKDIPVFIYSTSSHQREADIALDLGALCFFTKPINFGELKRILAAIVTNLEGNLSEAISQFDCIKVRQAGKGTM